MTLMQTRDLPWSSVPPDQSTSSEAINDIAREQAFVGAYSYLARRERTVAQVRAHLESVSTATELIDTVLTVLIEQNYLNDTRYAQRFAEDRRHLDGWGSERICQRLMMHGIDHDLVQQVVSRSGTEELDAAVALLSSRVRVAPVDQQARKRAFGMLVRRGYETDLAYAAIRRFESEAA
jgi:regulatory protein